MECLAGDSGRGVAGEEHDQRRDVVGIALGARRRLARPLARLLEELAPAGRGVDHACRAARQDRVRGHAVLGHGVGGRPGEPEDAGLGGRVVGLAGRAQRRHRRHVHDPPGLLLAHGDRRGPVRVERALEVDVEHGVPFGIGHVEDHPIAEDAGDVHEDVDPAPGVDDLADHRARVVRLGHRAEVGGRAAALLHDLIGDLSGRLLVRALATQADAEVVDDDLGSRFR